MNTCTVLECTNEEEDARGFCAHHLRRYLAGQVRENDEGYLVDHCAKNHALVGANVRWESSGRNGKRRRRCRECLRDKARRQAKNQAALKEVEVPKPYRPNDLTLTAAIRDFEEAQKHVEAKCKDNPSPYVDWEDPPTAAEARALCAGCPLLRACGNYAIAARETHGVWGGRVIVLNPSAGV